MLKCAGEDDSQITIITIALVFLVILCVITPTLILNKCFYNTLFNSAKQMFHRVKEIINTS